MSEPIDVKVPAVLSTTSPAKIFLQAAAESSTVDRVWITDQNDDRHTVIRLLRTVKDIDDNSSRSYLEHTLLVDGTLHSLGSQPIPKAALWDMSSSGITVVGYNTPLSPTNKSSETSHIEVCTSQWVRRVDTTPIHGKILGPTHWFGGCAFSPNEQFFVYTAALLKPKTSSFSEICGRVCDAEGAPRLDGPPLSKFRLQEDWGEKFTDLRDTGIFVLDLGSLAVREVFTQSDKYTVGQPSWVGDSRVVYTAWKKANRLLGMAFCYHRPCGVFVTTTGRAEEPPVCLSEGLQLARSPRVQDDTVVFLGHEHGFTAHNSAMQLYAVHVASPHIRTLVLDTCASPHPELKGYAGIYCDNLPRTPFCGDRRIAVNTYIGGCEALVVADIDATQSTPTVVRWGEVLADADGVEASGTLLAVHRGRAVVSVSSPSTPAWQAVVDVCNVRDVRLVARLAHRRQFFSAATTGPLPPTPAGEAPEAAPLRYKVLHLDSEGLPFQATVLYSPDHLRGDRPRLPLVLVPHGGPHAVTPTAYLAPYAGLVRALRCGVLHVNYRGSLGLGDKSLASLQGRIGQADVQDMLAALEAALVLSSHTLLGKDGDSLADGNTQAGARGVFDPSRIAVVGGSHGGFLAAHLCCRFPDRFRVCAMRNPVIDLPAMLQVTDIPDWCYAETLPGLLPEHVQQLVQRGFPTESELLALYRASPAAHLSGSYRTPTLLCLGRKDRRVPASQGLAFFHAIRGLCDVQVLDFPDDGHALDQPATELDHWTEIMRWLERHWRDEARPVDTAPRQET